MALIERRRGFDDWKIDRVRVASSRSPSDNVVTLVQHIEQHPT